MLCISAYCESCVNLTGGYKGYGLAMMVEIFCGILAGSAYGPFIRHWKGDERVSNLVSILVVKRQKDKDGGEFATNAKGLSIRVVIGSIFPKEHS